MVGKPLPGSQRAHLPRSAPPTNHGHTLAAWVTVALVIAGAVLSATGVLASRTWLFWAGLGVVVVGVVVGLALKAVGFGQPTPPDRALGATGGDPQTSKEES